MIRRLDHIAIAVADFDGAIRRFSQDFGVALEGTEDVISAQTRTAFLPIEGTCIELIHPLEGQGAVAKFLDRRGGGLHHICFETDDLHGDMERLTGKGYQFIEPAPRPGAHQSQVAFIHPKTTDGVLIELVQHSRTGAS
jgi:methylmalonyl-CoA/ethylmalonyl-CoA epimerase